MKRLKVVILPETLIYLSENVFGNGAGEEQPCTICFPKGINGLLSFTCEVGEPEGDAILRLQNWAYLKGVYVDIP